MLFHDLDYALFLDVDGTLIEIAPAPDSVHVPRDVVELIYRVADVLNDAVALISDRAVHEVDRLFTPYLFPTVGIHGCEWRGFDGSLMVPDVDPEAIHLLHDDCCSFVGDSLDLLAEYKSWGVAIHYGMAPERASGVRSYLQGLVNRVGPDFSMVEGQSVCEIKPAAYSRSTAILQMMKLPPFQGRRPIYIGSGFVQDAFEAVNRAGGLTIEVGTDGPTAAKLRIANIGCVHTILGTLLDGCRHHSRPH